MVLGLGISLKETVHKMWFRDWFCFVLEQYDFRLVINYWLFLIVSFFIVQSSIAFAQNSCITDSAVHEIQPPLTEQDIETVFYYFDNEWIPGAHPGMVPADSIQKAEVNWFNIIRFPYIWGISWMLEKLQSLIRKGRAFLY